ncbi:MAG: Gldg family protein [Phycisphaerales bacterium JB038]
MTTPPANSTHGKRPTATSRRFSAGINVAIYIAVLLVVVILINLLAQSRLMQVDLTSGRRHSLSPRTQQILANLEEPVELALILEPGSLPTAQLEDFFSILEAYDRAGGEQVRLTRIGASDAADLDAFLSLLDRLQSVYAEEVGEIEKALERAMATAETQLPTLQSGQTRIASALTEVQEPSESSQTLTQYAALVSNYAQALAEALAQTRQAIDPPPGTAPIPDYDTARAILAAGMQQPAGLAAQFANHFEILAASPTVSAGGRQRFQTLTQVYRKLADDLSIAREALLRPEPLELSEIVRAMQAESYLLILGAEHATALPLTSLFPDAGSGERQFAGEQAIEVVMASLTMTEPPLVFFLHAEKQSLFGPGSLLIGAAQRLAGQRIRLAEWGVALSAEPPQVPFPDAPVIYLVLPTADATSEGMERQANLAATVAELVSQGESILYHVQPSSLAVAGPEDVSLAPLAPFGVSADTGRHLLSRTFAGSDTWRTQPDVALESYPEAHLIGRALADLPTRFYQVAPLVLTAPPQRVTQAILIEADARGGEVWAESDWAAGQWQTAEPGGPRDDMAGPWPLALALERTLAGVTEPQRLVVIGASPAWLSDEVTAQKAGEALANPGNIELLEASVYWLAGLDALVAPGSGATEVARLSSDAPTTFVGYLTILGLPVLTLAVGIVVGVKRRSSSAARR